MTEIISMPKLGFDMVEGTLVRWLKSEGDQVQQGEILAEIETDKATVEVESAATGVLHKHLIAEGTPVPVGKPIAVIGAPGEEFDLDALLDKVVEADIEASAPATPPATAASKVEAPAEGDAQPPGWIRATPVARRIAARHGLSLHALRGSGTGGRIVKEDVERALENAADTPAPSPTIETPGAALPALSPGILALESPPASEQVQTSKLRAAIGRRMTAAKQEVPHFYLTAEVDAEPIITMRKEINARVPEEQQISVNDFIIKAAALALRQYPNINASLQEDRILRHGQINIGIAVAVDQGLLTIVVRDADRKPLRQLAQEAQIAIGRARAGRVRPDDVEGSTFTVSNLGMFDIDHFIAIINPPEAGILAIGSVRNVPVIKNGEIVPGKRLKVTLSADHRVTDGAEAARWLDVLKTYLEDPLLLLL